MREALWLLERADQLEVDCIDGLRQAWQEGVSSGEAEPLDFAELRAEARRELADRKG